MHPVRRARARAAGTERGNPAVATAMGRLTAGFTLEVTPKQVDRLLARREALDAAAGIYVTAIPGADPADLVSASERIAAAGLTPVPHVAARSFRDLAEVGSLLESLTRQAGVTEVLVIAGSQPRPSGSVESSIEILRSGVLEEHGISRVGVAGHPEGHPAVDAARLAEAVDAKNRFAAETGLDTYIVTQFCFAAEPYVRFERDLRGAGNQLQVRPGLPGVASMQTLVKYGISCGIGPSLRVLRKQARGFSSFLSPRAYTPDKLVAGLADAVAADPESRLGPVHFYPFGGLEATVDWVRTTRAQQDGQRVL
jgi:methylenetetrahydrofolate reductase (NADPH)